MGAACTSGHQKTHAETDESTLQAVRRRLSKVGGDPTLAIKVAHFTPATFPLTPVVDFSTCRLIAESWQRILNNSTKDDYGNKTSGFTLFFNLFFERLGQFDSSDEFERLLTQNSTGMNKLQARGAILARIVKFVIGIQGDTPQTSKELSKLGILHSKKGIKPWQYSVFVQTLLQTVATRLEGNRSNLIMEAWVNMFALVLKGMLPSAISHGVKETEFSVEANSVKINSKLVDVAAEEKLRPRRHSDFDVSRTFSISSSSSVFSSTNTAVRSVFRPSTASSTATAAEQ